MKKIAKEGEKSTPKLSSVTSLIKLQPSNR